MKDARLPWSWLAWVATVPAIGFAFVFWTVVALGIQLALGPGSQTHTATEAPTSVQEFARSFFVMAVGVGAVRAVYLLVPFVIARGLPRPALWFLILSPAMPAVRWMFNVFMSKAGPGHPLAFNLPGLSTPLNWSTLLVIVMANLAGAAAYLLVARAVKKPA